METYNLVEGIGKGVLCYPKPGRPASCAIGSISDNKTFREMNQGLARGTQCSANFCCSMPLKSMKQSSSFNNAGGGGQTANASPDKWLSYKKAALSRTLSQIPTHISHTVIENKIIWVRSF